MISKYILADFFVGELVFKENEIEYKTIVIAYNEKEIMNLLKQGKRKNSVIEIVSLKKLHDLPVHCMSNGFLKMLNDA